MIYTTLNKIRAHSPCTDGWEKLLKHLGKTEADDEPLGLDVILDSNGLEDCLWALRAVDGHDDKWRLLVCDYAEHVLHVYEDKYTDDDRPRTAIETARRYVAGVATAEELAASRNAACAAAWAAAWDAAGAAARAASRVASRVAGCGAEREWQTARLLEVITASGEG